MLVLFGYEGRKYCDLGPELFERIFRPNVEIRECDKGPGRVDARCVGCQCIAKTGELPENIFCIDIRTTKELFGEIKKLRREAQRAM
jgi:hypothetical protein